VLAPLVPASCPVRPGCVPLADGVPAWLPCDWPLWLPLALSRPDCGAGAPGVDDDLELLAPDAVDWLPALPCVEELDEELDDELEEELEEELDEELDEDDLEGVDGLGAEGELEDDEELDGIEGVEVCDDCWLVDSQAAKSRDAAPIKSILVTADLFIWLVPIA
jgi:hypothetical protein